MPPQNFGQQLLHTERRSPNQAVQHLKEEVAQIIDELYAQEEQTTDLNVKKWIGKAAVYFKSGFEYTERALNVQPIQMQEQQSSNGSQQGYNKQFSRQRQQEPA
jgi:hypothetical protein